VSPASYERGLREIGNSAYAYLQPDGGWGWSNAGLLVDGDRTLLVDTLFDLRLTRHMLDDMKRAVPAAASIETLVNSHANGDHTFGNQLVEGAEIIASERTAREMVEVPLLDTMRAHLAEADELGLAGRFIREAFGAFDFGPVRLVPPTRTFSGTLTLRLGSKRVELIEVGPAHTRGDIIVYVPEERLLFAGDILFIGGHPVMWAGPFENWVAACDRILALDVDVIVPGHGPVTDKAGVRAVRDYLDYVGREARLFHHAGVPAAEAARRIDLSQYADWIDGERIAVNVRTVYRNLAGDTRAPDRLELFGEMAKLRFANEGEPAR